MQNDMLHTMHCCVCVLLARSFVLPKRRWFLQTRRLFCVLCSPRGAQPVVFDAAYKPALTSLLAQAKGAYCPYVQGADMLVEQGLEQFQLWTERRAPRAEMEAAVFAKVDRI